jgi:hypothetical protein
MVSEEQEQFNREVIARQVRLIDICNWHCCANCEHLQRNGEDVRCALFACVPPASVIVVGCERWEERSPF